MSKVDRSKCNGGWPEIRSLARGWKCALVQSRNAVTLRCSITTPFGTPVEPEVNRMWAMASSPPVPGSGPESSACQSARANAPPGTGASPRLPTRVPAAVASGSSSASVPGAARISAGSADSTIRAVRAGGLSTSSGT